MIARACALVGFVGLVSIGLPACSAADPPPCSDPWSAVFTPQCYGITLSTTTAPEALAGDADTCGSAEGETACESCLKSACCTSGSVCIADTACACTAKCQLAGGTDCEATCGAAPASYAAFAKCSVEECASV